MTRSALRRLLPLLLACAPAAQAQNKAVDLSGNWVAEITEFDSTDYRRFSLQQQGAAFTGTLDEGKITGTLRDGKVEFHIAWKEGPDSTYSATLHGADMVGAGVARDGDKVTFRASREKPRPAAPSTQVFEPKEFHRHFSGSIAPVLRIFPGDTVKTWSVDAGGFDAKGDRRSLGGNPQTGPFFVEGALPGDTLVVRLLKVRLNRDTANSSGDISGNALNPNYLARLKRPENYDSSWRLDRDKGVAMLAHPTDKLKNYTVPLAPMLGCVGVAPPGQTAYRSGFLGAFGGNMDYNRIREGVTLYLPVFQPGALLFLGDGHAAQGDGELTGNALETSMDVEFGVDVVRGESAGAPRAENDEYRMAMGIAGSLNEALQQATTNMARWLERDFKLNPSELASILGTAMQYDVAEVVDPSYHVVARLPKRALDGLPR
jgi:acetamidase/formamidase